jgi:hypothetical protein
MDSERFREQIRENAAEIVRLHSRIGETYVRRSESAEKRREWEQACAEFHARYDRLAFPTGYQGGGALKRIEYGDPEAMEAAICFLEVRPYFFRSGYMFKDILRKCRKAPLSPDQAARLNVVEKKYLEWTERKQAKGR